jgi:hypothetical protein
MCVSTPSQDFGRLEKKGNYKIKGGKKSYKYERRTSETPTESERLGKGLPSIAGVPSSTAARTKQRLTDEHYVGVFECEILALGMRRNVPL